MTVLTSESEKPARRSGCGCGCISLLALLLVLVGSGFFVSQANPNAIPDALTAISSGIFFNSDEDTPVPGVSNDSFFSFGDKGTADGQFQIADGLAVDNAYDGRGNVYVADSQTVRIQKFDSDGKFLASWQPQHMGKYGPSQIAASSDGMVYYVMDGAILKCDGATGKVLTTLKGEAIGSKEDRFDGVTVLRDGNLLAYSSFGPDETLVFMTPDGKVTRRWKQAISQQTGHASYRVHFADDSEGNLFAVDEDSSRVLKFGPDGKFLGSFAGQGETPGLLYNPRAVSIDRSDRVYVADNAGVEVYDSEGRFLGRLKRPQSLYTIFGLAFDRKDNLFAAGSEKVYRLPLDLVRFTTPVPTNQSGLTPAPTPTATPWRFGGEGTQTAQFDSPRSLAIDGKGNIYVADYQDGRIQRFDPDGQYLSGWQFSEKQVGPRCLAADKAGKVYACGYNAIYVYDGATGKLLRQMRDPSATENGYASLIPLPNGDLLAGTLLNFADALIRFDPNGKIVNRQDKLVSGALKQQKVDFRMAVDSSGNIFAVDRYTALVVKFSPDGKVLTTFGGKDEKPGKLESPNQIGIDSQDHIFVQDNNGLEVFDKDGQYLERVKPPDYLYDFAFSSAGDLFGLTNTSMVYKIAYSLRQP